MGRRRQQAYRKSTRRFSSETLGASADRSYAWLGGSVFALYQSTQLQLHLRRQGASCLLWLEVAATQGSNARLCARRSCHALAYPLFTRTERFHRQPSFGRRRLGQRPIIKSQKYITKQRKLEWSLRHSMRCK